MGDLMDLLREVGLKAGERLRVKRALSADPPAPVAAPAEAAAELVPASGSLAAHGRAAPAASCWGRRRRQRSRRRPGRAAAGRARGRAGDGAGRGRATLPPPSP